MRNPCTQTKGNFCICGDYSVTVNHQLETQHLMPSPDDPMHTPCLLFYKDWSNGCKQSGETSQRWLALSTHSSRHAPNTCDYGLAYQMPQGISKKTGSFYLWPPRSSSIPRQHPSQLSKFKGAPAKSLRFALVLQQKRQQWRLEKCDFT